MDKNNICYIASAGAGKTTKLVEDAVTNAANESCKIIKPILKTN